MAMIPGLARLIGDIGIWDNDGRLSFVSDGA